MMYKTMMTVTAAGLLSVASLANAGYLLTADPGQVDDQQFGDLTAFTIKLTGITPGDQLSMDFLQSAMFTIKCELGDAVWTSFVPDAAFDNAPDEFSGANFVSVPTWPIGLVSGLGADPADTPEIILGILTVSAGNSSSVFSLTPDYMATAATENSDLVVDGSTFEVNVVPEPVGMAMIVPAMLMMRRRRA